MEKNLTIYVCSHKKVSLSLSPSRQLMLAGANQKNQGDFEGWQRDDIGDNISNKNLNYSELTAIYWLWKHAKDQYIGIEHYRRFFTPSMFKVFSYQPSSEKAILHDIEKYDMILPRPIPQLPNNNQFYKQYHYLEDFDKLEKIISERHPSFVGSFQRMRKLKWSYLFNVWITKKKTFDAYAAWLFDILFTFEKDMDISSRTLYQQRIFGFLAERLFTTWIIHHPFKIKHYYLSLTEFSFKRYIFDFIIKKRY